jgi:hypothetical protein
MKCGSLLSLLRICRFMRQSYSPERVMNKIELKQKSRLPLQSGFRKVDVKLISLEKKLSFLQPQENKYQNLNC